MVHHIQPVYHVCSVTLGKVEQQGLGFSILYLWYLFTLICFGIKSVCNAESYIQGLKLSQGSIEVASAPAPVLEIKCVGWSCDKDATVHFLCNFCTDDSFVFLEVDAFASEHL